MFSDLLRQDRERSGLSTDQAARRFSVSPNTYRKLEADERAPSQERRVRVHVVRYATVAKSS